MLLSLLDRGQGYIFKYISLYQKRGRTQNLRARQEKLWSKAGKKIA